jgi:hypothetical protein
VPSPRAIEVWKVDTLIKAGKSCARNKRKVEAIAARSATFEILEHWAGFVHEV